MSEDFVLMNRLGRLYQTFWSQIGQRLAGFSDLALNIPPGEVNAQDMFDAKYLSDYLEQYVDHRAYAGKSLRDRIKLGYSIVSVEKPEGIWILYAKSVDGASATFRCSKLMVATGLSSNPYLPDLPGADQFSGKIVHQVEFGSSGVLTNPDIKNVTVIGGAKSSADMVYAAAKAGKMVSWVIRESGNGPASLISSKGQSKQYRNSPELGSTRVVAAFSPTVIAPYTWTQWLLHSTFLGRSLIRAIWSKADAPVQAMFDKQAAELPNISNLRPTSKIFWTNGSLGLVIHEDFWKTVSQIVKIYKSDIAELHNRTVRLTDGSEVPTDALLAGTGWRLSHTFFTTAQCQEYGLPYEPDDAKLDDTEQWSKLDAQADKKVLARFPTLADPPPYRGKETSTTPFRLWNYIASLKDDTIAFLGYIYVPNAFKSAEVQAIWATAYLDKTIDLPSPDSMRAEITLWTTWNRRRYLNKGHCGNYLHYDLVPYTDRLLEQLGLSTRGKGFMKDLLEPCTAAELAGPRNVYLEKHGDTLKADK
ncbi:monooxygenase [Agyrium rufum]|nr:monooxygenase [Agyrium rufum]